MESSVPISTRSAERSDLDVLVDLFDGYRQFYEQPSDPEAARDFLRERMERGESQILIAEADGQVLGFTQLYPTFSSMRLARVWILNDLFVDPAQRQRGAGRALLEAAQRFAEQDGAARLMLETQRTNSVAQSLYLRLGWEPEDDFLWFSLPLGDTPQRSRVDQAPFGPESRARQ